MYRKNAWEKYKNQKNEIMDFAEDYKEFISVGKTERLCVREAIQYAEKKGFIPASKIKEIKPGDKLYFINKDKNIALYIVGKKPIKDGLRVLGAHIDSPRIDVKQNPLYEKDGFAMLDTHYYGGIKKYQWVTLPLSLHGIVIKKDNTKIEISIGEDENDPVFGINDLLVHLALNQLEKPASKVVEGEDLDLTIGNMPLENGTVKENILAILSKKYGITEEDFISSEIEITPSGKARDFGLDRSMIMGYGHDDRVCGYTSLRAICDIENPEYTSCCILVDKEEVGSIGATGAHSLFFENTILRLLSFTKEDTILNLRETLEKTKMLSSDVSIGLDPIYSSVCESKNTSNLGNGVTILKYTGSKGKLACNDSAPEYIAWIRSIFDESNIYFQTSELGRVDQGGGGTIAYILGNTNMNVIDCGIPVLNMHSPWEIVSKVDVYEAYQAYIVFLTK